MHILMCILSIDVASISALLFKTSFITIARTSYHYLSSLPIHVVWTIVKYQKPQQVRGLCL